MRRDGEAWRFTLASAGHPPAAHVSGSGSSQLGGGTVLGALPEPVLERHEATLEAGETLVLCTDGWHEAGPVAGHLGPEALAEMTEALRALPPAELTARLRGDAIVRSGGVLRDDMVVLAVRPAPEGPEAGAATGAAARRRDANLMRYSLRVAVVLCAAVALCAVLARPGGAVSASSTARAGAARPAITIWPIPFGPKRKREMAEYSARHYGHRAWRLRRPG